MPHAGVIRRGRLRAAAVVLLATVLAGCVAVLSRNPVPSDRTAEAIVPGMPDVRAWAGRPDAAMERDFAASFAQEMPGDFPAGPDGVVVYPHLAISGGGANGAFGAGFLNGWTTTGKRPVFKVVTGVSTGALMAPFAFVGPPYDKALRDFYTTTRTRDIFAVGSMLSLLGNVLSGDALADTGPLADLIDRHVDADILRAVATAHARGRRLYIGTADLDSQQFVVWNMGAIASSVHPDAAALFRRVMLASASIPIAFPPVLFDVEVDGRRYDELHVDGGVGANVFLTGGVFRPLVLRNRAGLGPGRENIFIIHNGQLVADPQPTPRTVRGIAMRSLSASGRSAVIGDLFRIYTFTLREGAGFQWVTIGREVNLDGAETFDPEKMRELYDIGYQAALSGPQWITMPPGAANRNPDSETP